MSTEKAGSGAQTEAAADACTMAWAIEAEADRALPGDLDGQRGS